LKRKHVVCTISILLAAGLLTWAYTTFLRSPKPQIQRNVLLITLDTTRADHLGCYGYQFPTSPQIDQLAAESVLFDKAIAQAAVTPVSHASMLTGLDPYHHGLRVLHGLVNNRLSEKQLTVAEVWQQAGGQTAAFVSAFPAGSNFGLAQGFEHFDEQFPQSDGRGLVGRNGGVNTGRSQRRANHTSAAAIKWLDETADQNRPFLMWVHYFDPHDAKFRPPEEFVQAHLQEFDPSSKTPADVLRTIYDVEVRYMDTYVGELLNALKQRRLWDNTIVILTADHGEGLGDHDWWSHGILYQEQIRVPLLVKVPGIPGGSRVSSLVRTTDLMPTMLEAAGLPAAMRPPCDGESLLGCLRSGRTSKPRFAYSDSVNMLGYGRPDRKHDEKFDKLYCLMNATHKLIYHQLKQDKIEFYDLASDPREQNNLAAAKPESMQLLLERLQSLNAFSDILPGMSPSDQERTNKLKSLGYVE
jgi:arylsulfatase A-like enzyme